MAQEKVEILDENSKVEAPVEEIEVETPAKDTSMKFKQFEFDENDLAEPTTLKKASNFTKFVNVLKATFSAFGAGIRNRWGIPSSFLLGLAAAAVVTLALTFLFPVGVLAIAAIPAFSFLSTLPLYAAAGVIGVGAFIGVQLFSLYTYVSAKAVHKTNEKINSHEVNIQNYGQSLTKVLRAKGFETKDLEKSITALRDEASNASYRRGKVESENNTEENPSNPKFGKI
ncbi:MAG: hypothetical protein WC785_00820 [Tatlockia sp.]|jgi:hypothetical protein